MEDNQIKMKFLANKIDIVEDEQTKIMFSFYSNASNGFGNLPVIFLYCRHCALNLSLFFSLNVSLLVGIIHLSATIFQNN